VHYNLPSNQHKPAAIWSIHTEITLNTFDGGDVGSVQVAPEGVTLSWLLQNRWVVNYWYHSYRQTYLIDTCIAGIWAHQAKELPLDSHPQEMGAWVSPSAIEDSILSYSNMKSYPLTNDAWLAYQSPWTGFAISKVCFLGPNSVLWLSLPFWSSRNVKAINKFDEVDDTSSHLFERVSDATPIFHPLGSLWRLIQSGRW